VKASTPYEFFHCDIDSNGDVKGYASDAIASESKDIGSIADLFGDRGFIRMTKDIGMGAMFTSTVDMPYPSMADNFAHFFKLSEQLDTSFRYYYSQQHCSVLYSRAVLIQPLPFTPIEVLEHWTTELDQKKELFKTADPDFTRTIKTALNNASIIEERSIRLFCHCSKEMLMPFLYALGAAKLKEALAEKQAMEIVCSMCGKKHAYSPQDIIGLVYPIAQEPPYE
jgi:molecular chaperone Hsp33